MGISSHNIFYLDIRTLLSDYFKTFEEAPHQLTQFFKNTLYHGWSIEIDEASHPVFLDRTENPYCESKVTLMPSKDLGYIISSKLIIKSEDLNADENSIVWVQSTEMLEDFIEGSKCQKRFPIGYPNNLEQPPQLTQSVTQNSDLIPSYVMDIALKLSTIFWIACAAGSVMEVAKGKRNPGTFISFAVSTVFAAVNYKLWEYQFNP